jgi:hypothetical protein
MQPRQAGAVRHVWGRGRLRSVCLRILELQSLWWPTSGSCAGVVACLQLGRSLRVGVDEERNREMASHPNLRAFGLRRWVLILLAVLGLGACSADGTYLPALLADPMADYQAPGLVLFDTFQLGEHKSVFGSAPVHAKASQWYRIEDQSEVQDRLLEAVAYAESVGWQMQQESAISFSGVKELEPGMGEIFLWLGPEDPLEDPEGPRVLGVRLSFDTAPE